MGIPRWLGEVLEEASGPSGLRTLITSLEGPLFSELAEACWRTRLTSFDNELQVFRPGERFPPISITGRRCELMCKYCLGRYLRGMIPAESPSELLKLCSSLAKRGAEGVLISGGFDKHGVLPVRPFLSVIRAVKESLGLTIAIHPGLVDRELAEELFSAGVDIALFDIVGDEETIRNVIGLNKSPRDYAVSLRALREAGIPVLAPHVCLGVRGGELSGELEALKMARAVRPDVLVLIIFVPTRGTPFWGREPPSPGDVGKLMAIARLMFPNTPVALGCMRPRGPYKAEVDALAVRLGLDRIALPSRRALEEAEALGLHVVWRGVCCAVP